MSAARPSWLVFRLGEDTFAVAMAQVARVAEVDRLHPLPGDLEGNLGLAVQDGVVLGVLDLDVPLGRRAVGRRPAGAFPCVFARFPRGVAGFPVDALVGLERSSDGHRVIDPGSLEVTP